MSDGGFPQQRLRRLRRTPQLRQSLADVRLGPQDLIYPLFVKPGEKLRIPVSSMPQVAQLSPDQALADIRRLADQGLRSFIFFGIVDAAAKDAQGSAAWDVNNPVHQTLRLVRDAGLEVNLYADLCFCEYTDHGHCGPLEAPACPGTLADVDNDATLEGLGRQAVLLAQSGADAVAPSGMMDGMVGRIRSDLDSAGLTQTLILSYAIKYASAFYGPFREAGQGGMKFGDRKGYQMDFRRSREWRSELQADLDQGADMVMVKPAAAYLDVIQQVRQATAVPVAAYHVSGEYSMLCAAGERGWLDLKQAALETTYAIKRAGADLILTYFAPRLLQWLA